MELNDYQQKAMTTCMDTCENETYMLLNLVGEVGEPTELDPRQEGEALWPERYSKEELLAAKALDPVQFECLYQGFPTSAEGLCKVMGWDLEAVAQENLAKLAERAKNGTIAGNGDGVTKEERNA